MAEKKCFKCGEIKPLADFYKHAQMADGHVNKCKTCNKTDVSKNYRVNIHHYKAYDKSRSNLPHRVKARLNYSKTDAGIKSGNRAKRKYTERNIIKCGASTMVGNAVRDGKLIKPDNCSECGNTPNRLHGHHDDYALPLVVTWLCPACHKSWHKLNGEGLNG